MQNNHHYKLGHHKGTESWNMVAINHPEWPEMVPQIAMVNYVAEKEEHLTMDVKIHTTSSDWHKDVQYLLYIC